MQQNCVEYHDRDIWSKSILRSENKAQAGRLRQHEGLDLRRWLCRTSSVFRRRRLDLLHLRRRLFGVLVGLRPFILDFWAAAVGLISIAAAALIGLRPFGRRLSRTSSVFTGFWVGLSPLFELVAATLVGLCPFYWTFGGGSTCGGDFSRTTSVFWQRSAAAA
jgi:hypothetical protein